MTPRHFAFMCMPHREESYTAGQPSFFRTNSYYIFALQYLRVLSTTIVIIWLYLIYMGYILSAGAL